MTSTKKLIKDKDGTLRDKKTGKLVKGAPQETNKNGTAGAPTKYDPALCEKMVKFFSKDNVIFKEVVQTNARGEEYTISKPAFVKMPTFEDFAEEIGVCFDTLTEWRKAKDENGDPLHPEFSSAYRTCKEKQRWFLANNALNGVYNANFAKFVAINITDWEDKSKVDNTHDIKNLSDILDGIQKDKK